jgi:ketosteroid isomerase-like protein
LASLQGLKLRAEELKIDLFGGVGIVTCILEASYDSRGAAVRGKDRATFVFVKDQGEWRIAHEHSSPIPLTEP